ncbi:MAG: hypothetical protein IJ868_05275 [Prevotella sp.]|nr:hypothetical protein [Prevotella sp.]
MSGIVRYPVSVVDHKKSVQDPMQDEVNALKEYVAGQQARKPDNTIEGTAEIEDFLQGTTDSEKLNQLLAAKQNISDAVTTGEDGSAAYPDVSSVLE